MFYFGGVGLAFFLTLLLVSKRKKTIADIILAVWLFVISIHLLLFYLLRMKLYPQLLGVSFPFPLIHGPFLYLYTMALTNRLQFSRLALLHFIPFLAVFIYLIPFLSLPIEEKINVFKNHGAGYETFNQILKIIIIISGLLYFIASSLVLRKHRVSITDHFSNTEKVNLKWLQYLIYWIGLIWIMVIFTNDDWIYGFVVLFILFIGFFGIRQIGIFYSPELPIPLNGAEIKDRPDEMEQKNGHHADHFQLEKKKYQKSGLSIERSKILHRQLTQLMNDKKLYARSDLSLAELAEQLNTQPNHLSQVINELEAKNFYDYINTLRIEEFKRVAASADSKRFTLLALAQHCGFSSKSSFNRYFRKVTGLSPSEFIQTAPLTN
ncbi:MAG TPA: helix-turn-helix domain-containing protein [Cyclobacteriaceae bacterium]